jgi:hypothetical protein
MTEQTKAPQEQRAPLYLTQGMLATLEKGLMGLPYGEAAPVINDINNQLAYLEEQGKKAHAEEEQAHDEALQQDLSGEPTEVE